MVWTVVSMSIVWKYKRALSIRPRTPTLRNNWKDHNGNVWKKAVTTCRDGFFVVWEDQFRRSAAAPFFCSRHVYNFWGLSIFDLNWKEVRLNYNWEAWPSAVNSVSNNGESKAERYARVTLNLHDRYGKRYSLTGESHHWLLVEPYK